MENHGNLFALFFFNSLIIEKKKERGMKCNVFCAYPVLVRTSRFPSRVTRFSLCIFSQSHFNYSTFRFQLQLAQHPGWTVLGESADFFEHVLFLYEWTRHVPWNGQSNEREYACHVGRNDDEPVRWGAGVSSEWTREWFSGADESEFFGKH